MSDTFDPYREALVMETTTEWPEEYDDMDTRQRARLEQLLHAKPEEASELVYVRTHSGFCRNIVVTAEDLERVSS